MFMLSKIGRGVKRLLGFKMADVLPEQIEMPKIDRKPPWNLTRKNDEPEKGVWSDRQELCRWPKPGQLVKSTLTFDGVVEGEVEWTASALKDKFPFVQMKMRIFDASNNPVEEPVLGP